MQRSRVGDRPMLVALSRRLARRPPRPRDRRSRATAAVTPGAGDPVRSRAQPESLRRDEQQSSSMRPHQPSSSNRRSGETAPTARQQPPERGLARAAPFLAKEPRSRPPCCPHRLLLPDSLSHATARRPRGCSARPAATLSPSMPRMGKVANGVARVEALRRRIRSEPGSPALPA